MANIETGVIHCDDNMDRLAALGQRPPRYDPPARLGGELRVRNRPRGPEPRAAETLPSAEELVVSAKADNHSPAADAIGPPPT